MGAVSSLYGESLWPRPPAIDDGGVFRAKCWAACELLAAARSFRHESTLFVFESIPASGSRKNRTRFPHNRHAAF